MYLRVKGDILSILVGCLRVESDILLTVTQILSMLVRYLRIKYDILLLLLTF
jgi:hypothetical protein